MAGWTDGWVLGRGLVVWCMGRSVDGRVGGWIGIVVGWKSG